MKMMDQRCRLLVIVLASLVLGSARGGVILKADNADSLNLGSSWVGGTAPGAGDTATWNAALSAGKTYSLGANLSWLGMAILADPGGNITFGSGNTLTLGADGIAMTPDRALTLNSAIQLGAPQVWEIARNYLIPQGGVDLGGHTLTLSGGGTKQFKCIISGPGTVVTRQGGLKLTNQGNLPSDVDLVFMNSGSFSVDKDVVAGANRTVAKSLTFLDGRPAGITSSSKGHVTITNQNQLAFGRGGQSRFSIYQQGIYHTTFLSDSLDRATDSGSFLFTGSQLGIFPATVLTNSVNVLFVTPPNLERTEGASGPTTLGILRGATANYDNSEYGLGLATYDADKGVRLLDFSTEYTMSLADGENAGNNVRLANVGGASGQILTNQLTSSLTVVNSLSLDVTGPHGNAGIVLLGGQDAVLRLSSGILFARESGVSDTNDDATDRTYIRIPVDFNGKQGLILNARTDGMKDGSGPALTFDVSPVNDGGNGIMFAGHGSTYLQWPSPTAFTGPVMINSGWFRITGSGNSAVIPTKLLVYGGSVQDHGHRIADSADIEIHAGNLLIKSGATNSGDGGNENFRDLTMMGGTFTLGGGGGGTCTMRSATLLAGTMGLSRGTLTTVTNDMVVAGCKVSLHSNGDSQRSGTRLVVNGALTVSNTVETTPYVPFNMGFSWYRTPAYLSVTNRVAVYGNSINTNGVAVTRTYDADPRTMLAEIRLNGAVEVFADDGAAEYDFDVDASFADAGTLPGRLVKTGAGTLRMTAASNNLSSGVHVAAGRLVLDGGVSSDVSVVSGAVLAGDGSIAGSLEMADAAVFQARMVDATTCAKLEVSGAVTGTGTVLVDVPEDQPVGEWLVMTAGSIAPSFSSTTPGWTLSKRAGGTELWLGRTQGTIILLR